MELHCSSCGSTDRQDLDGDQGYTDCCNKHECGGGSLSRFGTPADFKRACCWGKANAMFEAEGRDAPDGSSRLASR